MTQIDYGNSIMEQIQEKRQYLTQLNEDFVKENGTPTIEAQPTNGHTNGTTLNGNAHPHVNGNGNGHHVVKADNKSNGGNDTVINIAVNQAKKKKNKKKRPANNEDETLQGDKKRVKFNLEKSQTRGIPFIINNIYIKIIEFFMYGKVATQKVDESCKKASPSKGAIKTGKNGHKKSQVVTQNGGGHKHK